AFLIGALSIVGLPPFGGTWSKWLLIQGTVDTGLWLLTATLLVSSLLNIMYLVVIPVRGFFAKPASAEQGLQEAPIASLVAIGVAVLGCIILFFSPDPIYRMMEGVFR
ncbi:MAG: monovalent cation/H+ antiporter subunit D family protein, partial [Halieaceae bacterium]|nr:monovalent cation/H+ antiporter subunit D family protein [Halieaceae bacterium]